MNDQTAAEAHRAIQEAEIIYVLGFGFDRNNCERIGLTEIVSRSKANPQMVLFTNFRNSGRVKPERFVAHQRVRDGTLGEAVRY